MTVYSMAADLQQLAMSTSLALDKHEELQGLLTCGCMLPLGMRLNPFFTNSSLVCTAHAVHTEYF